MIELKKVEIFNKELDELQVFIIKINKNLFFQLLFRNIVFALIPLNEMLAESERLPKLHLKFNNIKIKKCKNQEDNI